MTRKNKNLAQALILTGCLLNLPRTAVANAVEGENQVESQASKYHWSPASLLEGPVALVGGAIGVVLVPTFGGTVCAISAVDRHGNENSECLPVVARMASGCVRMIGTGAIDTVTGGAFHVWQRTS